MTKLVGTCQKFSQVDMATTCAMLNSMRWRNIAAIALCLLASTAMLGDLLGSRAAKGLGIVSTAAPFPKVFCQFEGLEGFACEFIVCFEVDGEEQQMPMTPQLYARLAGPYNRRNVYGAALAAGPRLPPEIWQPVFRFGFSPDGPLQQEFGLPTGATNIAVVVRSKSGASRTEWYLQPTPVP